MTTCSSPNNTIVQMPGNLNLQMVDDNDLAFTVTWNFDITDYEFEAFIVPKDGSTEIPMQITITSPTTGKMNILISLDSILDLQAGNHKWYMNWLTPSPESYTRTVLSGMLVLTSR